MCFYLICLAGFSYGLGADKFVYMEEFLSYPDTMTEYVNYTIYNLILKSQMPLWTLVNMIAKTTFDSFYLVQIAESIFINISVCYLVTKYTHRYFLFLLIYFFSLQYFILNTEIMREGFSLALVMIGMHEWIRGKKWPLFVNIFIGTFFHVSALTGLLFPLAKFKPSWKILVIATFVSVFIWITSDFLLNRIIGMSFANNDAFSTKVMYYSIQASSFFGYARSLLTYLIFPFIVAYSVMLREKDEEKKNAYGQIAAYIIILGIIASSFAGFYRFYNYVLVFYLIIFSEFTYSLFDYTEHLIIRIGTFMGKCLLTIIFLYHAHYTSTNTYFYDFFYPYTCILNEDKSVYFREVAHSEGVTMDFNDNNLRNFK